MTETVPYYDPAKLYTAPVPKEPPFPGANPAFDTNLADAVRRFMALSPAEQRLACIGVRHGVAGSDGWLYADDIKAIYARDDFPR